MENSTTLLTELLEEERNRDYHFKWFIIDIVINFFISSWLYIPLAALFGIIGALMSVESAALGAILGFALGVIIAIYYFFAWIYHLVKWLNARGKCEELNRKKRLLDNERERERD